MNSKKYNHSEEIEDMKKSIKGEMIEAVKAMGKVVESEGKGIQIVIDETKKEEVLKLIDSFEKFFVKEINGIYTVAYKTKRSDRFLNIGFVKTNDKKEETKKVKVRTKKSTKDSNSFVPTFSFDFKMQKDCGLSYHIAEFTMGLEKEEQMEEFLGLVNEFLKKHGYDKAEFNQVDDVKNGETHGYIVFGKVKGQSKQAYNEFKKALTASKRSFKNK